MVPNVTSVDVGNSDDSDNQAIHLSNLSVALGVRIFRQAASPLDTYACRNGIYLILKYTNGLLYLNKTIDRL